MLSATPNGESADCDSYAVIAEQLLVCADDLSGEHSSLRRVKFSLLLYLR